MNSNLSGFEAESPALKVSISARLISFAAYIFPALGGALSSLSLISTMQALRNAEGAGFGAVTAALAEATYPVLICLYLSLFLGVAVIAVLIVRMIMQTQKASPPAWFFLVSGIFCLIPTGLFLEAQSLLIEVLISPRASTGIVTVASNISLLTILSLASAALVFVILLVLSVLPFSSRSRPRWFPLTVAIIIELLIFAFTIFFQLRLLWLNKQYYELG